MSKFPITNDVRSELTQAIDSSQTTMRVAESISPFRQIPALGAGETLHLTIVDNLADVAKIEIVNVTAISDETSYWQLTIERGAEGTSSYAFDAGAPVFLAITQEAYHEKADTSDLGTAAYEDVTTSNVDTTPDRVTKTGDFGLGATNTKTFDDLNDAGDVTQFFTADSGAANSPFAAVGVGLNIARIGGRNIQLLGQSAGSDPLLYYREQGGGDAWTDWVELYHTGNLESANLDWTGVHTFANGITTALVKANQYHQNAIHAHGNTSGAGTIALADGNYQTMTLTGNSTFSFKAPPGPCSCNILITNDGAGNKITLPGGVVFETGAQNTANGAKYVLTIIYDGTDYWVSWAT